MKHFVVVSLCVLVACARAPVSDPQATGRTARVERVVDGDTLIAHVAGDTIRVRLIGIDTPETVKPDTPVQCFGPEASAYAKTLLQGEEILLTYDVDRLDRFGRALAYVHRARDGLFVNLDLVARGYATVLTIPPNVAHVDAFVAAQRTARENDRGLWGACGTGD